MPKQSYVEKCRLNPDTGEYEFYGVTADDGRRIAKKGDGASEKAVAQEFLASVVGEKFSRGFNTPENREIIANKMEQLFPDAGYTTREMEMVVADLMAVGDITKPAPATVREEPSDDKRIAEYESWSQTATASMRQQRRSEDAGYRAWHEATGRVQRSGTEATPADFQAMTSNKDLVDFVRMFKTTPRDVLRPRSGWVSTPGFLNGQMPESEFNEWIETASAARLI
jgi:hypothetical protein